MIKAVLFDLDNTLIDFMKLKHMACQEAINAMIGAGLQMDREKALKILFELYDKYGIEYKKIFQAFLLKTTGKIDWKILASGIVAYRRVKNGYLEPYPRVMSTLLKIKALGIKLAIVSDAPRERAWTRLAATKLADFFDVVVTYEDTGRHKPNRKPFEVALAKLRIKPHEALMVGDWPERDIAGAKRLGIKTCLAKYGMVQKRKFVKADYAIDAIDKLIPIIKKIK
jgi:HAD superfamily hydrolase (TIGR02253 family)